MSHQLSSVLSGPIAFIEGPTDNKPTHRRFDERAANIALAPKEPVTAPAPQNIEVGHAVQGVKTIVGYNADSKDATFAAAMYLSALGAKNDIAAVAFTDEIPYAQLASYGHVILIAPSEINPKFLDKMRTSENKFLTVFTHRNCLTTCFADPADETNMLYKLTKGKFGKVTKRHMRWNNRLTVVRPDQMGDMFSGYGELEYLVSGTMIDVMQGYLARRNAPLHSPAMEAMLVAAKRYVSMAAPITNDPTIGLNELILDENGKPDLEIEKKCKAALFNLFPKIAIAMRHHHRAAALRSIALNSDTDAYMHYWKEATDTYARSAVIKDYKLVNAKGVGIVLPGSDKAGVKAHDKAARKKFDVKIATMACAENRAFEMLTLAMTYGKSFVTYEDMHGVRLWRVYAKDLSLRNAIVNSLGGEKVWDDGLCLRTYTRLEK